MCVIRFAHFGVTISFEFVFSLHGCVFVFSIFFVFWLFGFRLTCCFFSFFSCLLSFAVRTLVLYSIARYLSWGSCHLCLQTQPHKIQQIPTKISNLIHATLIYPKPNKAEFSWWLFFSCYSFFVDVNTIVRRIFVSLWRIELKLMCWNANLQLMRRIFVIATKN